MRDFAGLEELTSELKRDLLDVSYHLCIGAMDDAYKSVKKLNNPTIWQNMAHMCVKTKRLDVAEVCLGNMANARGSRAVKAARIHPEKEAQIAMLAIQLGLIDDAERLYIECGRYDLLVELYMSCNRWDDAINVCSRHARIQLKPTHYAYAKWCESIGDYTTAIIQFELSQTHSVEVPRMLFDMGRIDELEEYIKRVRSDELLKWWAQHCESSGNYEQAIEYYTAANDTLSTVRVYCYRGEEAEAAEICRQTNDLAASFHLARQLEATGQTAAAIDFYVASKKYNHAIRLACQHQLDNDIMSIALQSTEKQHKILGAEYFEANNQFEKAVLLYQKGGRSHRALEMCFEGELFESLKQIADQLSADTDPSLLIRCAEFFISHDQFDKAVHLLQLANELTRALDICIHHNIRVDETLCEKLTPPKTTNDNAKRARDDFLRQLAQLCDEQGSHHLACKKFTQAGEFTKAIKCLIKSGDTEKIIYYASMTKRNDVFVIAGNYLQQCDWKNNSAILKNIIAFYTKAKAMSALASFYEECAQLEIDEYRDYEKALEALKEALKFQIKAKSAPGNSSNDKDEKLQRLDQRVKIVERFVSARDLVKSDPPQMIMICKQLIEGGSETDVAVRVGDVYALLIEYSASMRQWSDAMDYIDNMRTSEIQIEPYLEEQLIRAIYSANNKHYAPQPIQNMNQSDSGYPNNEEEVNEEVDM